MRADAVPQSIPSALKLLFLVIVSIFLSEAVIMLLLPQIIGTASTFTKALIDSALLVIALFPLLFFYVYRPLRRDAAQRIQTALRENETRIREAQRIARMGSWEHNVVSGSLWWSDETYRIFGRTTEQPITFSSFLDYIYPNDREHYSRAIEHALVGTEEKWQSDYRIVLPQGAVRYLHEEGTSLLNAAGQVIRRIGTVQDITERKQTEEVLYTLVEKVSGQRGETFFRTALHHLSKILQVEVTFVGELSEDGTSVRTIAACMDGGIMENFSYELAGTPCSTVMGVKICSYPSGVQKLFPDDQALVDMGIEGYIGVPLFSSTNKPMGILVALTRRPLTNLTFSEFACQMFSVSVSAEMERMHSDRLFKSEKAFSDAIVDSAISGIMIVDNSGRVIRTNSSGERILGRSREDLIGKNIVDIYPETMPFLTIDYSPRQEILLSLPDGRSVHIGFSNAPLKNMDGLQEGVVVLFRDLSDIIKLQTALKKRDYFDTVNKVVAGVAHEVRNPLFGISSIGQILEREIESPQHRALISAMLKETTRLKNLIEELLLYTRPSRLDFRQIDLGLLLMELEHHTAGKRPGIRFSMDVPLPVTITADRDKISQVFLNLFNNAIEAARSSVTVTARRSGDHTEITIHDDGYGISPAHREKIFEPFFTTKKGGTGLGLPICKKLIEDHEGTIEIASAEGEYTTVTLTLC